MKPTTERQSLADRLKEGLNRGIEFAQGDGDLKTTVTPIGRIYTGEEVVAIRKRRDMSQSQFARLLSVSVRTLQSWEQGARKPSKPTMRLLQIFDSPEEFRAVLQVGEARAEYGPNP